MWPPHPLKCLITYWFKFESHLKKKWRYYRQTIFNQLDIMVPYVDIIGVCHSVAILLEIHVLRHKCHVRWLRSHFKRRVIIGLGQETLGMAIMNLRILLNYSYSLKNCIDTNPKITLTYLVQEAFTFKI